MHYVSLNDDITKLPLSKRLHNALRRNGVNSINDMLISQKNGELKYFIFIGKKCIAEVERWTESLYTGKDGYLIATSEKAAISREESINKYVKSAANIDKELLQELLESYEIKPSLCRTLIEDTMRKFPCTQGETLIYRLYENKYLDNALHLKLLSILEEREEGITLEIFMERIPRHLRNTTIVEEMLLKMERQNELRVEDDIYIRVYPSIIDYINSMKDDRNRNIILDRFNGQTLQEIGDKYNLTRERVRQICGKTLRSAHKNIKIFREDKYLCIFSQYRISREDFIFAFNESINTYEYCSTVVHDSPLKKPLESILEDENIPIIMRKQAERAIYKNYISVNGQRIRKNRPSLVDYYIKIYCTDLTKYTDFEKGYHAFIDELGLSSNEDFEIYGRGYMNRLNDSMFVLWNQWSQFRYYDIQSRDYGDFLENINLTQYEGLEISTLKLFRENSALMEEYDIHDEYELHNLLRKIYDNSDNHIDFGRMPTLAIGKVDRESQIRSLLLQYSPIKADKFGELYEEIYGFKAASIIASATMKNFDKYFFNGEYSFDVKNLSENEYNVLRGILTEDFYLIEDIQKIYLHEFLNADIEQINSYTLKTLDFRVYSNYVVRNTYASSTDYFNALLTRKDVFDMREYPKSVQRLCVYSGDMYKLRQEREIIEFGEGQYINIKKLNQLGFTKEIIKDYCRAVSHFVEQGEIFTIHSIIADGFSHSLDNLGFDEYFYSAVLLEDRENFSCKRLGHTRIFIKGKSENIIYNFLTFLISKSGKMDIYDLQDLLEQHYGIILNKDKLIAIIRSTDMYYDTIMETVYIDYDTYFEEV